MGEGHGLQLLRSRLASVFGDKGTLRIESRPGATSCVMEVPARYYGRRGGRRAARRDPVDPAARKDGARHGRRSTGDPVSAPAMLAAHAPDVLFLDVEMPELNGFELLERVATLPLVVFTTAFDRYALAAFETNSVDYLVKPIELARLERALDKVERFRAGDGPDARTLAREVAAQLARPRGLDRLASRWGSARCCSTSRASRTSCRATN
jgi:CheY-like chemotaxis protein